MIKQLAEPILKQLEEFEKQNSEHPFAEIPRIHFARDYSQGPIEINGFQLDEQFLNKLEQYIQDEIDMMHMPTVIH